MSTTATIDRAELEGAYTADPVHSSFGFAVKYQGVSVFRGTLDEVEAKLVADGDNAGLEGVAKVESISIRSPQQFRDHVVLGEDFFNAGRYPEVSYSSGDVSLNEDGTAVVAGELTIKDQTHPVTAQGTWTPEGGDSFGNVRAHLNLEAVIDRSAYGITWNMDLPTGGKALANEVTLTVELALISADAAAE